MTQFLAILSSILVAGLGATIWLFRKGGPYNPMKDFTELEYLPEPIKPDLSVSTPEPSPFSVPVETTPTGANKSHIDTFCDAIARMEGANPANNNEGNCRCSPVGYLPMYGKVTCNPHNFAVFPSKALGRLYLENKVHHTAVLHPTWTFYDFFNNYAPSSDGNQPNHYAEVVAKACGVIPTTVLSKYLV